MRSALSKSQICLQVRTLGRTARVRHSLPVRPVTAAAPQDAQAIPDQNRRVFAAYQLYKGKAAAAFKIIRPTWQALPDGSYTVSRQGTLLVEVAPAQQGSGTRPGERRYEWDSKLTFALSATELGDMIASQGRGIQPIFHDPAMNTGAQGQKSKTFRYAPIGQDGQDLYMSVEMNEAGKAQQKFGLPVTRGEHEVVTRIAKTIIPHLLGIDEVIAQLGNVQEAEGPPF